MSIFLCIHIVALILLLKFCVYFLILQKGEEENLYVEDFRDSWF